MQLEFMLIAKFPMSPSLGLSLETVENFTPEEALDWCETLSDFMERAKDK